MIWNAAIYCTRVERDPFVVALRCTLVYLFGSWNTLVQAAAPQCWMVSARQTKSFQRDSKPGHVRRGRASQVMKCPVR